MFEEHVLVTDKKGRTEWDTHCHKQFCLAQTRYPNETLSVLNKRLVVLLLVNLNYKLC